MYALYVCVREYIFMYVRLALQQTNTDTNTKIETNRSCINSAAAFYIHFLLDYIRIFVGNEENCGEIITYYNYNVSC